LPEDAAGTRRGLRLGHGDGFFVLAFSNAGALSPKRGANSRPEPLYKTGIFPW
jgi:hypothetical protein